MAVRSNSLIPLIVGGLFLILAGIFVSWLLGGDDSGSIPHGMGRGDGAFRSSGIEDTPVETLSALTGKVNSLGRDFEAMKAERDALQRALMDQANQPMPIPNTGPDMAQIQAYVDEQLDAGLSDIQPTTDSGPTMTDIMQYVDDQVNHASQLSLGQLQGRIGQLESRMLEQTQPPTVGVQVPSNPGRGEVRGDGRFWVTPTSFVSTSTPQDLNRARLAPLESITDQTLNLLAGANAIARDGGSTGRTTTSSTLGRNHALSPVSGGELDPTPVFTIPQNATLMNSKAMTALIGRVPLRGSVRNPIPFKVVTGADNLAANGIYIHGIENAIWSGSAVGDGTLECVRGNVDSVTFVFQDGRIQTIGTHQGHQHRVGGGLGWISDARGFGCIPGQFVSNAPKVMRQLFIAGAASGYAQAFSQSQVSAVSNNGVVAKTLTGDANQYALGLGLSNGFTEWASYVKERADDLFDAVVIQPGAQLVINITQSIAIDYNPQGRKVSYLDTTLNNGGLD